MNKGAIFDVDGTLLDSMPIWENASERFLEELGIEAEPGLNEIMFRMSLDEGAAYLRSAYNLAISGAAQARHGRVSGTDEGAGNPDVYCYIQQQGACPGSL